MGRKHWPAETREGVVELMRQGMGPKLIRATMRKSGKPDEQIPPTRTMRDWAEHAGIDLKTTSNGNATPPRADTTVSVKDLRPDLRAKLQDSVNNVTHRLSQEAVDPRDFAQLARGLKDLMGIVPDLMSIEERLNPGQGNDRTERRRHGLTLVGKRGLGRGHGDVPGESGGSESAG